jgi:hypothetical protein
VIPKSISEIPRPPNFDSASRALFDEWAAEQEAVLANQMVLSFVARSDEEQPTLITGMRVEVVKRSAPLAGTWVRPDGAGPGPNRVVTVDLDVSPPTLTKSLGWDFPLTISKTELEAFTVIANVSTCDCEWRIVLESQVPDGSTSDIVVDDDGIPFRLTGSSAVNQTTFLPHQDSDRWPR